MSTFGKGMEEVNEVNEDAWRVNGVIAEYIHLKSEGKKQSRLIEMRSA